MDFLPGTQKHLEGRGGSWREGHKEGRREEGTEREKEGEKDGGRRTLHLSLGAAVMFPETALGL